MLVALLSWPLLYGVFRLRARGREHLPEGGFVLAANHTSNLDAWPLGLPLFPGRWLRFMAKSELFWFPLGLFIKAGGAFKVRRGESDMEAITTAADLARAGHAVMMFPEGTRRRKGLVKKHQPRAHTGAARIALEARVPLIPAAIRGTDSLLSLGPIRVAYGDPLPLPELDGRDVREVAQEVTDRLMTEIERLERAL